MRPVARNRWARIGGSIKVVTVGALLLASCGLAQTESTTQSREASGSENAMANGCLPDFPQSNYGNSQYYSLYFQFRSCLTNDVPLSIDIGATEGRGVQFSGGTASGQKGSAVVWDLGDGKSAHPPMTTVPMGSGSGYGETVGFMTLPFWDGLNPAPFGPCANSIQPDKGTATPKAQNHCELSGDPQPDAQLMRVNDFKGSWAVYLPTATIVADVINGVPYPYVAEFYHSSDPTSTPGAVATGTLLGRYLPGRSLIPFFTKGSAPYFNENGPPSQSPPGDSFIPTTCLDNLVVVNGENSSPKTQSDWSTAINDGGHNWNLTVSNDGDQAPGMLFLTSGWMPTAGGQNSTIQLGDNINKQIAQRPHYFKAYLREVDGAATTGGGCNGSESTVPAAMIGGRMTGVNVAGATLPAALIANSSLTSPNFSGSHLTQDGGDPSLAFSRIVPDSNPVSMVEAQLPKVNLTGAIFGDTDMTNATLKGARLFYADLSKVTGNVDTTDTLLCHTYLPGDTTESNFDCGSLPGQHTWPKINISNCKPSQCGFVGIYNNTTRTLTKGLQRCEYGNPATNLQAPGVISPLDTAHFGFQPGTDPGVKGKVNCVITYSNGPWGKVRIRVSNLSGSLSVTTDAGDCWLPDAGACLPKAAPAQLPQPSTSPDTALWPPTRPTNDPIKVSTTTATDSGVTKLDVILCEPEAFTEATGCSTKAQLPSYQR